MLLENPFQRFSRSYRGLQTFLNRDFDFECTGRKAIFREETAAVRTLIVQNLENTFGVHLWQGFFLGRGLICLVFLITLAFARRRSLGHPETASKLSILTCLLAPPPPRFLSKPTHMHENCRKVCTTIRVLGAIAPVRTSEQQRHNIGSVTNRVFASAFCHWPAVTNHEVSGQRVFCRIGNCPNPMKDGIQK